jgi:hypothetical protein
MFLGKSLLLLKILWRDIGDIVNNKSSLEAKYYKVKVLTAGRNNGR